MVQELKMTCPHCKQVAEIYLSTNACVIILNCPSCCSPIMYFDQKIFILSRNQMEAIKNKAANGTTINMLRNIVEPGEKPSERHFAPQSQRGDWDGSGLSAECPPQVQVRVPEQRTNIDKDDITNLKIELALCNDIDDFISRM